MAGLRHYFVVYYDEESSTLEVDTDECLTRFAHGVVYDEMTTHWIEPPVGSTIDSEAETALRALIEIYNMTVQIPPEPPEEETEHLSP